MSKLGTLLKIGTLAGALAFTAQAAAATFNVPVHYTVKLVDGKTSDFGYSRYHRTLDLSAGRHQIVLLFEDSFGNNSDNRLIQAANPIVVEINDMPANAKYSFKYNMPRDVDAAQRFAREQKITLINSDTKANLNSDQASYYILTSDSGFAILRDYREDLASVGRLYAPAATLKQAEEQRYGTNDQGVAYVQARSIGAGNSAVAAAAAAGTGAGMSNTVTAARDANNAAQAAQASGQPQKVQSFSSSASVATYNQLVQMYENADDNTKLQFVKYIMSH